MARKLVVSKHAQKTAASSFVKAATKAGLATKPGKSAIEATYQAAVTLRAGFGHTHSIELDAHFATTEPEASRWDYGVGIRTDAGEEMAIWLEPHPASSSREIEKMLSKLAWLKAKLELKAFAELKALRDRALAHTDFPYRWLVTKTGGISIAPMSKEARQLAIAGLDQPRRYVQLP